MKVKNDKIVKEEEQDEKAGAIDQIKKKYGFSSSGVSIIYACFCYHNREFLWCKNRSALINICHNVVGYPDCPAMQYTMIS